MTDESKPQRPDLTKSTTTIRSDSENYDDSNNDISPSPPSSSRRPMIMYQPPTFWSLLRGAAINLVLPFVNGLMLGFGELLAHEAAFRLGWSTYKVGILEAVLRTDALSRLICLIATLSLGRTPQLMYMLIRFSQMEGHQDQWGLGWRCELTRGRQSEGKGS